MKKPMMVINISQDERLQTERLICHAVCAKALNVLLPSLINCGHETTRDNDKDMKMLRNCAIVPRVLSDEFCQDVRLTIEVRQRLNKNGNLQVHVTWEEQSKYSCEAK